MPTTSTLNDGIDVHLVIPPAAAPTPSSTPSTSTSLPPTGTDRALPRTGVELLALLLLAVALLAFGVLLVRAARLRGRAV